MFDGHNINVALSFFLFAPSGLALPVKRNKIFSFLIRMINVTKSLQNTHKKHYEVYKKSHLVGTLTENMPFGGIYSSRQKRIQPELRSIASPLSPFFSPIDFFLCIQALLLLHIFFSSFFLLSLIVWVMYANIMRLK